MGFPNANLLLDGNLIAGAPGPGILIASASGVTVNDNSIVGANQVPAQSSCGANTPLPSGSMVALDAVNVSFSGNTRDGGSLGLAIDSTCQSCAGQSGY